MQCTNQHRRILLHHQCAGMLKTSSIRLPVDTATAWIVHACLQALVKFEGCQAILEQAIPEAEAATPSAEMQLKLQEVPTILQPCAC